jgi:hypothetical protein
LSLFVLAILSIKACKVFRQKPKASRGLTDSRLKVINFPEDKQYRRKTKIFVDQKKRVFLARGKLKEISPDN